MAIFKKIKTYIIESIHELKKVTWPTKKQTTTYTVVVIAMSLGVAVFFAVLDYIFNAGISLVI